MNFRKSSKGGGVISNPKIFHCFLVIFVIIIIKITIIIIIIIIATIIIIIQKKSVVFDVQTLPELGGFLFIRRPCSIILASN